MKRISYILISFFLLSLVNDYRLINSIDIEGLLFTTDNLRNSYVVNTVNELVKYNARGEKIATYSEKKYGQIRFIDCSNPLKVLIFYDDFSYVITLDNTLSPQGKYKLEGIGIDRTNAICLSIDNNIWVYDERVFKLRKIDNTMNIVQESEDLSLITNTYLKPDFLLERDSWLYMNDSTIGILVFDTYGTYYKTIPIKGLDNFQVIENVLIYYKDSKFNSYHLKTFETNTIALPDTKELKAARIEKDRLYLLKKNKLDLYAF